MYKTLDNLSHQIRLLKLLPGQQTSRLETQLLVVSLDSQLAPYEALSYVWGQACDLPDKIMVDGVALNVTWNLYCALRSLRHNDQPRMLWVDAICINQADTSERSRQVRLMSRIFSQATRVVAWIVNYDRGDSPPTPNPAVVAMNLLASDCNIHWSDERLGLPGILGISQLFKTEWWFRVWTVQEAVVAQSLIYVLGKEEITRETIAKVETSYKTHGRRRCCDIDTICNDALLSNTLFTGFQASLHLDNLGSAQKEGSNLFIPLSHITALFRERETQRIRAIKSMPSWGFAEASKPTGWTIL
ncbi:hypothetical protein RB594_002334 [Gaeumannomyces avenae]